ncbi:MAG: hypothetical protein JWM11_113 [Planctomycetaceae bacterium]|nr:hypothetical protein [Planctomycetaceae bacterium]
MKCHELFPIRSTMVRDIVTLFCVFANVLVGLPVTYFGLLFVLRIGNGIDDRNAERMILGIGCAILLPSALWFYFLYRLECTSKDRHDN